MFVPVLPAGLPVQPHSYFSQPSGSVWIPARSIIMCLWLQFSLPFGHLAVAGRMDAGNTPVVRPEQRRSEAGLRPKGPKAKSPEN